MVHAITDPREYVEFYWFWLWQYCQRNSEFRELSDQYPDINFKLTTDTLEPEMYDKIYRFELYPRPLNYDVNYSSEEIVNKCISGELLIRPKGGAGIPAVLPFKDTAYPREGEPLEYMGNVYEKFNALVAINFDEPFPLIVEQLRLLKERCLNTPTGTWGTREYEFLDAEQNLIRIRNRPGVSFDHTNDVPRAVGLWLWDTVYGEEGAKAKRGAIIQAIQALRQTFDVDKLGYAASDDGVFRKLLSRTKACIEAAEVLRLK